jgi:hypothetical protein
VFGTSRFLSSSAVALVVTFLFASLAVAQPENDLFADALVLDGPSGQVSGSTVGATKELGEPFHVNNAGGASIWYRWVAPRGGLLTVYTFGSSFDTLLEAYSGDVFDALDSHDGNDDADVGFLQSFIAFPVVSGTEYRIAVDGFNGRVGNVFLTWFLGSTGSRPANDNFANSLRLEGDGGRAFGTTVLGTLEDAEPEHFIEQDGSSIWFSWSPPIDGEVTFTTEGISFLHVIAAYEGTSFADLERVGRATSIDNIAPDDIVFVSRDEPSEIRFRVETDKEYHIAIDGVFGHSGITVVNWLVTVPCDAPDAPEGPLPEDNEVEVERRVTLRWNQERLFVERVIYGDDNRRDAFEVLDPDRSELLDSVVVIVDRSNVTDNGDGTFALSAPTLRESGSFCESERFLDQPVPGVCSGFFVGTDRIVTSGNCISDNVECGNVAFIFGFEMMDAETPVLTFDEDDVYFCDGILGRQSNPAGSEWAVLQLDRDVVGRAPLSVRRNDSVADNQELFVVGHPFGLPVKLADGARVRDNSVDTFFVSNLDTALGSAGSPVFNSETLTVEGIFVRGENDLVEDDGCLVSRRCDDDLCRGQDVVRATEFEHLVPPDLDSIVYEVWFGEGCANLEMIAQTTDTSFTLPDRLGRGTIFCWRIGVRNECGIVFSPRWTFVTSAAVDPVFDRGDVNADRAVNLSDGVSLLSFLFQQGEAPSCLKSADIDDNSAVNLTDAVYLLNHLFLQGPAPIAPFGECGTDPSPEDGIPCESFPPCDEG